MADAAHDSASRERDHYATLEVTPDATDQEIRDAYYRLAKEHHPDLQVGASADARRQAELRMRALVAAHEILADPVRRRDYDASRARAEVCSRAAGGRDPAAGAPSADAGARHFLGALAIVLAISILAATSERGHADLAAYLDTLVLVALVVAAVWLFLG